MGHGLVSKALLQVRGLCANGFFRNTGAPWTKGHSSFAHSGVQGDLASLGFHEVCFDFF